MKPVTPLKNIRPFANPMNVWLVSVRFHSPPNFHKWLPLAIDRLSRTWMRVSWSLIGRKNGTPSRKLLTRSMPVSLNGAPDTGLIGPLYGRGLSSREYWNRNSFDVRDERKETRLPFTAWDRSFSRPFALAPHASMSKVPFFCSDHV